MECFGIVKTPTGFARCTAWNPLMSMLGISAHFCFKHAHCLESRLDDETRKTLEEIHNCYAVDTRERIQLETDLWIAWCRRVETEDSLQIRNLQHRVKRMRDSTAVEDEDDVEAMRSDTGWCKTGVTVSALAKQIKRKKRIALRSDRSSDERHESTCAVCLEDVHAGGTPCLVLSCSHKMCFACALKHQSNKCATCRAVVTHGLAAYV